jgi:hypothetical protein
MYAHVGGLTKRVNVLSKQDELFFASMYKEQRKAHAWELFVDHPGFCHASWSLLAHCQLVTGVLRVERHRRLVSCKRQEVCWLGQRASGSPSEPRPHHPWLWYLQHLSVAPTPLEK